MADALSERILDPDAQVREQCLQTFTKLCDTSHERLCAYFPRSVCDELMQRMIDTNAQVRIAAGNVCSHVFTAMAKLAKRNQHLSRGEVSRRIGDFPEFLLKSVAIVPSGAETYERNMILDELDSLCCLSLTALAWRVCSSSAFCHTRSPTRSALDDCSGAVSQCRPPLTDNYLNS